MWQVSHIITIFDDLIDSKYILNSYPLFIIMLSIDLQMIIPLNF